MLGQIKYGFAQALVKLGQFNYRFVRALVKRDLWKYFSNPTGYVFITLFIFLSAAAAFWQDRFFLNNLANLDQLNRVFPYLLLFFIPALTMAVWSEERKQATDELLLTLPATSLEVVLGKYLATLGIYSVSLLLSLSHVLVLVLGLGSPDLGLMFSNYLGYWLAGSAMIAVGMLASLLTANATIAFILGALFCSSFTFIDSTAAFSGILQRFLAPLGIFGYFGDFAKGVMSLSGFLYFCSVTGLMLYLNVQLVERRHWPRRADGYPMWLHHGVRALALLVLVVSLNAILGRVLARVGRFDATAEELHSISAQTRQLIGHLSEDRPVFIQAYVSPEVPEQYVQTRANLVSVLREIDAIGGAAVQVLFEDTESYSDAARDAREKFGIVPLQIPNPGTARVVFSDVFLGMAFTCGAEEQVIRFLDRGLSAEYEITRSIRVVANTERKKIGVLDTAVKLFGGFDFQVMRSDPPWPVVEELRKQYDVVQIPPSSLSTERLDSLLVALPSSLSQQEMDQLSSYVQAGNPTLLLVDPLPIVNIGLSPTERSGANMNPFMRSQGPPPKEKGDIRRFMSDIGVSWDSTQVVWDSYNPHPDLAELPQEVVFLGKGNENEETFNEKHKSSADLQELVLLYPGEITQAADAQNEFEPLLRSGKVSGRLSYYQMVQRNFLGVQLNRNLSHRPDEKDYVVAAHVKGPAQDSQTAEEGEKPNGDSDGSPQEGKDQASEESVEQVNVIVIADVDFISDQFFRIRERGPENLNFDNVTFFLNCIDILVGDESFVALRSKRVRHRTLKRVEEQTRNFIERRIQEEQDAEAEAEKALADAQRRLDERVEEVRGRPDLDRQTKQIMARNLQEVENRRFEVLKANIEAEKEVKVQASKENMETQIRRIQGNIRVFAVLLPPIPVLALGVAIFVRRQRREREGAAAERRLRT